MTKTLLSAAAALLALQTSAVAQTTPSPTSTPSPSPAPAPMTETAAEPAVAPTPAPEPQKQTVTTGATNLKVGGVVWPLYFQDLTEDSTGRNGFDVGRAYVNIEPSWGDKLYGRITPDLVRQGSGTDSTDAPVDTNTTGNLVFRVKYAYLVYKPADVLDLKVGMQQTAYTEFEEGVWGYRFVAQTVGDAFYDMSSSDFGVAANAKLLGGALEIASGVYNGESYTRPETNKYKEGQLRATWRIFPAGKEPGLRLTGYGSYGLKSQDADKVRGVALLSYQTNLFSAAGGYVYAQDGDGAGTHVVGGGPTVFGSVRLPKKLSLLGRVDLIDPDSDTDDDGRTRIIGGIGYDCTDKVRMVADYQTIDFEASGVNSTQTAFVHWEAKF